MKNPLKDCVITLINSSAIALLNDSEKIVQNAPYSFTKLF